MIVEAGSTGRAGRAVRRPARSWRRSPGGLIETATNLVEHLSGPFKGFRVGTGVGIGAGDMCLTDRGTTMRGDQVFCVAPCSVSRRKEGTDKTDHAA